MIQDDIIKRLIEQVEHAFIYGVPPSDDPPPPRATCCKDGGQIEWAGPIRQQSWGPDGGWNIYSPDMDWAGPLNFCPWCGSKLPEKPL